MNHAVQTANLDVSLTSLGGESVDLGGFNQYIFRRNLSSNTDFSFHFDDPKPRYDFEINEEDGDTDVSSLGILVSFGLASESKRLTELFPNKPAILNYEVTTDQGNLFTLSFTNEILPVSVLTFSEVDYQHPTLKMLLKYFALAFEEQHGRELDNDQLAFLADKVLETLYFAPELLFYGKKTRGAQMSFHHWLHSPGVIHLSFASAFTSDACHSWIQKLEKITSQQEASEFFDAIDFMLNQDLYKSEGFEVPLLGLDEADAQKFYDSINPSYLNEAFEFSEWIHEELTSLFVSLVFDTHYLIEAELNKLAYLGPLRTYPARLMPAKHEQDPNWLASGGFAWQSIRDRHDLREKVNKWLGAEFLKTPYKLSERKLYALEDLKKSLHNSSEITLEQVLASLGSTQPVTTELLLTDLRSDTYVTHRDIGVGMSQIMPILVYVYGSKKQHILIEQPEIHLHPALQAELGDVFIESALGDAQNRFILETHSEHLILRIMKRMRQMARGELPEEHPFGVRPEDVAILYVEPGEEGAVVKVLELDEEGQLLDPWPGGFFEEGFEERFG